MTDTNAQIAATLAPLLRTTLAGTTLADASEEGRCRMGDVRECVQALFVAAQDALHRPITAGEIADMMGDARNPWLTAQRIGKACDASTELGRIVASGLIARVAELAPAS